jgi:hypothetical protein
MFLCTDEAFSWHRSGFVPGTLPGFLQYLQRRTVAWCIMRWFRRLLLVMALGCAAVPEVWADQPGGRDPDLFRGELPTFRSGDVLPYPGIFTLELKPSGEVRYLSGLVRARGDVGYGGTITVVKLAPRRYRIVVSRPVGLELMQNYAILELWERSGDRPTYHVQVDAGSVHLQVRSSIDVPVSILIWPASGD